MCESRSPGVAGAPGYPVQRQAIGEFADNQIGQQAGRGHALRDRRQYFQACTNDGTVAVITCVLLSPRLADFEAGGSIVELFRGLVAEDAHRLATIRTGLLRFGDIALIDQAKQVPEHSDRAAALAGHRLGGVAILALGVH